MPAGARQSHRLHDPAPAPQSAQGPLQQPPGPCAATAGHCPPARPLPSRQLQELAVQHPCCRVELR